MPGVEGQVIGEPSFTDALAAIASADALTTECKRYWSTSIRQMAGYLDRPPTTIPARIAAINTAVRKLHPETLGVNPKTFTNHRANVRAALLWFNRQTQGTGRNAPMADAYRRLLALTEDRHARDTLSPLFRYLTAAGVAPEQVADAHIQEYSAFRLETDLRPVTPGRQRFLVRTWNNCHDLIKEWPRILLIEPALNRRFVGPTFDDFPAGLRDDIDAYCAKLAIRHKNASGRTVRPCVASTIAMRRRELIAAVRTAAEAGICLEELQSLRALLRPDRVKAILEHYWNRNGEVPRLYTVDLAWKLMMLARSDPGFDPTDLARLDDIRRTLEEHRSAGMTEKNRALVRQVLNSDIWPKVVALPQRLMAEARAGTARGAVRAANTAELAVAIRLLVVAPVRVKNLASIRLGVNLVRPGGLQGPYHLVFPDYDVKNRLPLEFPLDETTTRIIDEYVHVHRPRQMRGRNHDRLFPGAAADHLTPQDLSERISKRLWKSLGLTITAHQFRHAAAAIILKSEPGNYELVRRILGHRSIQTTTKFYIGLETIAAARRFGEIVTAAETTAPSGRAVPLQFKKVRHD